MNDNNEYSDPKINVSGDSPTALRKDLDDARRDAYRNVSSDAKDEDGEEYNAQVKIINQPEGIDAPKNSGKSKLWMIPTALLFLLVIVGGILIYTLTSKDKKDEISVGAENSTNRGDQYKQIDESLKSAFANASPAPSPSAQPTPPNANGSVDPNFPPPNPGDWDKVAVPGNSPKGDVGDSLEAKNPSGKPSPQVGDNIRPQINVPNGPARPSADPNGNPQILEVRENADRTRENPNYQSPGSSARNTQTSYYYYARSESGEPILNKLTATPAMLYAQKPRFNDVLPVRILGAVHTLGSGGLARMVLTRAVEGNGYFLPKGTFFIGRISGGEADRLFIALVGYIDPVSQKLITLGGDVQGIDGGLGLKGERKKLDNRFKKFFGEAVRTSRELGIAYLLGRRGGGSNWNNGIDSRVQSLSQNFDQNQSTKEYILVQSGQEGYIVVNDLPPATDKPQLPSAPAQLPDLTQTAKIPVETSGVNQTDLNALANIGEAQIKELMMLSPQDRERVLQKYSPQVREILREVLK